MTALTEQLRKVMDSLRDFSKITALQVAHKQGAKDYDALLMPEVLKLLDAMEFTYELHRTLFTKENKIDLNRGLGKIYKALAAWKAFRGE